MPFFSRKTEVSTQTLIAESVCKMFDRAAKNTSYNFDAPLPRHCFGSAEMVSAARMLQEEAQWVAVVIPIVKSMGGTAMNPAILAKVAAAKKEKLKLPPMSERLLQALLEEETTTAPIAYLSQVAGVLCQGKTEEERVKLMIVLNWTISQLAPCGKDLGVADTMRHQAKGVVRH